MGIEPTTSLLCGRCRVAYNNDAAGCDEVVVAVVADAAVRACPLSRFARSTGSSSSGYMTRRGIGRRLGQPGPVQSPPPPQRTGPNSMRPTMSSGRGMLMLRPLMSPYIRRGAHAVRNKGWRCLSKTLQNIRRTCTPRKHTSQSPNENNPRRR